MDRIPFPVYAVYSDLEMAQNAGMAFLKSSLHKSAEIHYLYLWIKFQ